VVTEKREHSIHVRICDEADAVLELKAAAAGREKGTVASEELERALLGSGHEIKVAAIRFARLGICGHGRERET
jgi:hypothetical protein